MATARTVISFRVNVPVLSEQMTETEPSASTAGRRRTTALRRAIRCTPIASVTVRIVGRPSGIAATDRLTTATNMSAGSKPRASTPKRKVAAATTRTTSVSQRAKTAICRRSGVVSSSTEPSMALILPISVPWP